VFEDEGGASSGRLFRGSRRALITKQKDTRPRKDTAILLDMLKLLSIHAINRFVIDKRRKLLSELLFNAFRLHRIIKKDKNLIGMQKIETLQWYQIGPTLIPRQERITKVVNAFITNGIGLK